MTRAYSMDLRERVVAAVGDVQSCRQVSALFRVSVSSVVKWAQLARSTGSPAPRPMGGRRGCKLDGERDWLLVRLEEKPDLTLHALLAELRDRGVMVSCDTLWRFLRAAGIGFQKKPCSPASRIGLTDLHNLFDYDLLWINPSNLHVEIAPSLRAKTYGVFHDRPYAGLSTRATPRFTEVCNCTTTDAVPHILRRLVLRPYRRVRQLVPRATPH